MDYITLFNINNLHIPLKMSTFVPVMKDLKDIEIKRLQAEVVKLSNELAQHENYVQLLQEENTSWPTGPLSIRQ